MSEVLFYLVLIMYKSSVIIPEPYTKEACIQAGEHFIKKSKLSRGYECIPAPKEVPFEAED